MLSPPQLPRVLDNVGISSLSLVVFVDSVGPQAMRQQVTVYHCQLPGGHVCTITVNPLLFTFICDKYPFYYPG